MSLILDGSNGLSDVDGSAATPAIRGTDANTGMFFPAADTIAFSEGGVEAARFDSSGQLGIGTTSPAVPLDVSKAGSNDKAVFRNATRTLYVNLDGSGGGIFTGAGQTGNYLYFDASGNSAQIATNGTERMRIDSSGNVGIGTSSPSSRFTVFSTVGGVAASFSDNTAYTLAIARSGASGNVGMLYGTAGSSLALGTDNAERMRITSGGYFKASNTGTYINSTGLYHEFVSNSNNETLLVRNSNGSLTAVGVLYVDANRNTTNNTFYAISYYNNGAGAYKFQVADSGNVTNTNNSYGAISDVKLKENIVDASPKLEDLCKVKVRQYNLKSDPEHKQIGVVAQELEEVFAGLVEETADKDREGNDLGTTTKQVKYSVFVPMLIKAIQEQQILIENLTTRLTTLENS